MSRRVLFVGESNPYGGPDDNALVPWPAGCSGWRLCHVVLGMLEGDYLANFDRANLVRGPWRIATAREAAARIEATGHRLILLGAKVASAFGLTFEPFARVDLSTARALVWPHPSGRNARLWTSAAISVARRQLLDLAAP